MMRQPSQPRSLRSLPLVGPVGAVWSEDGIDDLQVRRIRGLRTVLMSFVTE